MADISKFNTLNSIILDEINSVYTESIDYALLEDDIKNFAIAGKYGAGKSTIWNSYKKDRLQNNKISGKIKSKLNNVITISLGKYVDTLEKVDNSDIILESRIERQIINQILAQVDDKSSNQCKYRFKVTRGFSEIYKIIISLSIIVSVIYFFIIKEDIFLYLTTEAQLLSYLICFICFLFGVALLIYEFLKNRNITFSSINFQGLEAKFDNNNLDETILERDIKEIVLLLHSSKVEIVVFEDLDRYDNLDLFTRLRELNYLLNSFIINNKENRIVKFVYMIKDSLFVSKNRTKFFDFIIPVVPIVDSKTSESHLLNLFQNIEDKPNKEFLFKISLYIDDMRLLKNIVNEYIIYSKVIPLSQLNLDKDILFSLIVIKNISPKEFELLQEDRGYIISIFRQLESDRKRIVSDLIKKRTLIYEKIDKLKNTSINNKFEAMSLYIPLNLNVSDGANLNWSEFLERWYSEPERQYDFYNFSNFYNRFNYSEFLNEFITNTSDKKEKINEYDLNIDDQINDLNLQIIEIDNNINNIEICNYKKLISLLDDEYVDNLFSRDSSDSFTNLIRFLIINDLLNENYHYYKGYYDISNKSVLSKNDMIYMKSLFEKKKIDVLFKVDNPKEIIYRLEKYDFYRTNILNKYILSACLDSNEVELVKAIAYSIEEKMNYEGLLKIFNNLWAKDIEKYINILLGKHDKLIINTLDACKSSDSHILHVILVTILINKSIKRDSLELFKSYIEQHNIIISKLPENEDKIVCSNMKKVNIKFEQLSDIYNNRKWLLEIEKNKFYILTVNNVIMLVNSILKEDVNYGYLISYIYTSIQLTSTKEYVEENFTLFVQEYIKECSDNDVFTNHQDIFIKVLESNISEELKLLYIKRNEVIIDNLSDLNESLKNLSILNMLLSTNVIKFTKENLAICWEVLNTPEIDYVNYINKNLTEENVEKVFSENENICNALINSSDINCISLRLLSNFASNKITRVNDKLDLYKINILIENMLLQLTEYNVKHLIEHDYNEQILKMLDLLSNDDRFTMISMILDNSPSDDLIYMILNNSEFTNNVKSLVKFMGDKISICMIEPCRVDVLKSIIEIGLSTQNIEYILEIFNDFELKQEFIRYLVSSNKLDDFKAKLNDRVVVYIIEFEDIDINIKLDLIITKILHGDFLDNIKDYILKIPEIADLATVWENKYPLLDNEPKKLVADALYKAKMIKYRQSKGNLRINCC